MILNTNAPVLTQVDLRVSPQVFNLMMDSLADRPYRQVAGVINELTLQAQQQGAALLAAQAQQAQPGAEPLPAAEAPAAETLVVEASAA